MGQTTSGLPWPEDTDAVMAGAQAIRALAEGIDARPWYRAERGAVMSIPAAGGADQIIGAGSYLWETIQSNFTPGDAQGFIVPKAGLWLVTARATMNAVWAGNNWGTAVTSSSLAELGHQTNEGAGGGGTQRRSVAAIGMMRLGLAETVRMVVWQTTGNPQNVGGLTAGSSRWATRFSAQWKAP